MKLNYVGIPSSLRLLVARSFLLKNRPAMRLRPAVVLHLIILGAAAAAVVEGLTIDTNKIGTNKQIYQRRAFLHDVTAAATCTVAVTCCSIATPANAEDEGLSVMSLANRGGKPYAPVETLLPATRLKLWVDEAYALATALPNTQNQDDQYEILDQMNAILSKDPKLFDSGRPKQRTSRSTAQISTGVSSANKEQYRTARSDLSIPDKMAAMLNQADVERQWGMLQYAESKREESNDMRAALNYYTQSLVFGDTYQLTASKDDKKRMIRNDELPGLTAVITSDLDLRDLYRNNYLTSIEDARAEVAYQVKQSPDAIDCTDTVALMADAQKVLSIS